VPDAAAVLGVKPRTLRRFIRNGAPVVRKGRKGGGQSATLVNPRAIRAWLAAARDDRADERALRELASKLPHDIAYALDEAWQASEGIDKRKLGGILAATHEVLTARVLASLRHYAPTLPDSDSDTLPEPIRRMALAARHS